MASTDQQYFEQRLRLVLRRTGTAHIWTLQRGLCEVGRPDTRFDPRRMANCLAAAHRSGAVYRMHGMFALSRAHYLGEAPQVADGRRIARVLQRESGLAEVASLALQCLTAETSIQLRPHGGGQWEAEAGGRQIGLHFLNTREWLYIDSPWLWERIRHDLPHRIPVFVVGHAAYSTLLFFQLTGLTLLTTFKQYVRHAPVAEDAASTLHLTNVTVPVAEDRFQRFFDEVLPPRLTAWRDETGDLLRRGFALAASDLSQQIRRRTAVAAIQACHSMNGTLAERCTREFEAPGPPRVLQTTASGGRGTA